MSTCERWTSCDYSVGKPVVEKGQVFKYIASYEIKVVHRVRPKSGCHWNANRYLTYFLPAACEGIANVFRC